MQVLSSLLESFQPDVAFIDIGLPDIDGDELARQLRANTRTHALRLIALTGYRTAADKQRAKEAGVDQHVVKPADPVHLAQLLS